MSPDNAHTADCCHEETTDLTYPIEYEWVYQEIMNLAEKELEEGPNPKDECSDNTEHGHSGSDNGDDDGSAEDKKESTSDALLADSVNKPEGQDKDKQKETVKTGTPSSMDLAVISDRNSPSGGQKAYKSLGPSMSEQQYSDVTALDSIISNLNSIIDMVGMKFSLINDWDESLELKFELLTKLMGFSTPHIKK